MDKKAIGRETNINTLIELIKSSECKEALEYYERITKGQDLFYKPVPGDPMRQIALPRHVSVKDYLKYEGRLVEECLDRKRKSIDRLIGLSIKDVVALLGPSFGYDIDFYIREKLLTRGYQYKEVIKSDIEKFAVMKLGLPDKAEERSKKEKELGERIKKEGVHSSFLARWEYYKKVKTILE